MKYKAILITLCLILSGGYIHAQNGGPVLKNINFLQGTDTYKALTENNKIQKYSGEYNLFGGIHDQNLNKLNKVPVYLKFKDIKTNKWKTEKITYSDKNGNYGFVKLNTKKEYMIEIKLKGYSNYQMAIIPQEKTVTQDIVLNK